MLHRTQARTLLRLSDDERPDHGGDFEIRQGDRLIRTVRGITAASAARVAEAIDAEGGFDG